MEKNEREDFFLIKKILNFIGYVLKKTYKYKDDVIPNWKYVYYFFYQRILMFNVHVPWPVHYTSYLTSPSKIKFGKCTSPGSGPFQYIQGENGLELGDNVQIGPGVVIITSNHDPLNYGKMSKDRSVIIGNNVLIGAHVTILPRVHIGDNVVIGAGTIVSTNIPSDRILIGSRLNKRLKKAKYLG